MTTAVTPRRSCYVNFAEHLLNAYNPNMTYPLLPYRWSDSDWFQFINMISAFGFNVFEFWLVPRLFCREALGSDFAREFARQMNAVRGHAHTRGVAVKWLASLTTVGADWHTHCPHVPEEWRECRELWDEWTRRIPADIVGIFPGDPGGCSRNGCTHETFVDGALEVAGIIRQNLPEAEVEVNTWGTPFWGWGVIEGPPGWKGEFIQGIQHTAWRFDRRRCDEALAYLVKRLPQFPKETTVALNLGLDPDGTPGTERDVCAWAREIARTHRIVTWDFSLTEGENCICPHYRFQRLFRRRREERQAAPYSGGICFTMTPKLNQLSLFESAQSFLQPDADPDALARRFFERLFGSCGPEIARLMPCFETVPDWGNSEPVRLPRTRYHQTMHELAELLESAKGTQREDPAFFPSVDEYRRELLYFARLFRDLSGPAPDYDALGTEYFKRVYGIYDHLAQHVDPRPTQATRRLVRHFATMGMSKEQAKEPIPGKWTG